jgi:hypothetical protein
MIYNKSVEFIYCGCGCGFTRPLRDKWSAKRLFITGHQNNGRISGDPKPPKILKGRPIAEKNNMWKGDKVGYAGLHKWVRKYLPKPDFCQLCHIVPPCEVSNISRQYVRDITDWQWVCHRCHMIYDNIYERVLRRHVEKRRKYLPISVRLFFDNLVKE